MKSLLLISIVIFLVAGCASAGNKSVEGLTQQDLKQSIVVNKTTSDQVRQKFGSPMQTSYTDGGLEIWTYEYIDATSLTAETIGSAILTFGLAGGKSKGTKYELTILFNDDSTVKKFNMNDSAVEAGTGIF